MRCKLCTLFLLNYIKTHDLWFSSLDTSVVVVVAVVDDKAYVHSVVDVSEDELVEVGRAGRMRVVG